MSVHYVLEHIASNPILSDTSTDKRTVYDLLKRQDPQTLRGVIDSCLDIMEHDHDIDVSDTRDALEEMEITREFTVDVLVTVRVVATVEASSAEEAREQVGNMYVHDILQHNGRSDRFTSHEWTEEDFDIEDVYEQ